MYCIRNQLLTFFIDVQMPQLTVRLHTTILTTVRFSFSQNTEILQRQKKQKTLTKNRHQWQWRGKQINLIL